MQATVATSFGFPLARRRLKNAWSAGSQRMAVKAGMNSARRTWALPRWLMPRRITPSPERSSCGSRPHRRPRRDRRGSAPRRPARARAHGQCAHPRPECSAAAPPDGGATHRPAPAPGTAFSPSAMVRWSSRICRINSCMVMQAASGHARDARSRRGHQRSGALGQDQADPHSPAPLMRPPARRQWGTAPAGRRSSRGCHAACTGPVPAGSAPAAPAAAAAPRPGAGRPGAPCGRAAPPGSGCRPLPADRAPARAGSRAMPTAAGIGHRAVQIRGEMALDLHRHQPVHLHALQPAPFVAEEGEPVSAPARQWTQCRPGTPPRESDRAGRAAPAAGHRAPQPYRRGARRAAGVPDSIEMAMSARPLLTSTPIAM